MRLFIDECLSPQLARHLNATGEHDAIHPREEVHPGLILLPSVARELSLGLLTKAIAYLETLGRPSDVMVNHVLDVTAAAEFKFSPLPK